MTTALTADRHIIINIPKSKYKLKNETCIYRENDKEMQVEKVQQVLKRHRMERNIK